MKTFFVLLTALGLSGTVAAQHVHPHFGLKAGLNFANLNTEDNADLSTKTSFHVGALAHLHISQHFALQPELMFSGQGAKYDASDAKLNLSYINLPILAQYMTGSGFRLQTGPQIGALLGAKAKMDGSDTDVKDEFKKVDFSWAFGASYVTNSGFGIDARYNLGLSNINDADAKIKNRVFQVGVFYQFNVTDSKKDAMK